MGNNERDISCIRDKEENYTSFTKQYIIDNFVDSEGNDAVAKREL